MSAKAGQFNILATGNTAVTGVGFLPNVVIFFASVPNSDDSFSNTLVWSFGAATSTSGVETAAVGVSANDAVSPSITGKYNSTVDALKVVVNQADFLEFDLASFDADGFTVNTSVHPGGTRSIHFLALKMPGAKLLEGLTAPTTTGNKSFTGAGFQPDLVLLFGASDTGLDAHVATANHHIGAASSTSNEAVIAAADRDNLLTTENYKAQQEDACYLTPQDTIATADSRAELNSFDADGFTLNFTSASNADRFHALCLKGNAFVDTFDFPAGTGPQAISGVGFEPEAVLFLANGSVSTGAAFSTGYKVMVGAASAPTDERSAFGQSENFVNPANTSRFQNTDGCIFIGTPAQMIEREADLTSLDADGFTLNWSTAGAQKGIFIALSEVAVGGFLIGGGTKRVIG